MNMGEILGWSGGTLLLRDCAGGVCQDNNAIITERVGGIAYQFCAGEFFQNNPHILPDLVNYAISEAEGSRNLVDAYCGVGVFALAAAKKFENVAGVEISSKAIVCANANAKINGIKNCEFLIGKAETMFLKSFSSAERRKCFEDLFKYEIPALVISRKLDVFPECMEMAQKYGRTLLRTEHTSVEFTSMTIDFLNHELAPMITRHGVLMDVYGEGVLILGDSGIGKSETAIELIKRGHRLVADDAVEIRRIGDTLTGTAPELIRHYLEVRGIGVVDIQKLFGMSGVKSATQIDLVIQFERWQDEKFYDRLGLDEAHTQIMGVPIPLLTIPVSAGRNLAGIVELAVMNNRQKKYGINSAREFVEQIDSHIDHQAAQEKNR